MVLVTGNWKLWLAGMAASLIMFGVIFFTVIQPAHNQANQALKSGLEQTQQVLHQAQQQLSTAGGAAAPAGSSAASSAGQQALSKVSKLTSCIAAAGTDTAKIAACQASYGK